MKTQNTQNNLLALFARINVREDNNIQTMLEVIGMIVSKTSYRWLSMMLRNFNAFCSFPLQSIAELLRLLLSHRKM